MEYEFLVCDDDEVDERADLVHLHQRLELELIDDEIDELLSLEVKIAFIEKMLFAVVADEVEVLGM
jgi:hypothetical protein